jgi:hypothetical protein
LLSTSCGWAMTGIAVITKTFAPDFELCAALNRSVLEKLPETIDDCVIAPQSDLELLGRLAGPRTRQHPTRSYRAVSSEAIHLLQRVCRILLMGAALLLQALLPSRAAEPSTDSTWSQGLASGVNGPIPLIVVDQFGYPTKAAKIAVIRNPQVGYDSVGSFHAREELCSCGSDDPRHHKARHSNRLERWRHRYHVGR